MSELLTPGDFWVASGHHLCDRDDAGRLVATPDLWRAFLARPAILILDEATSSVDTRTEVLIQRAMNSLRTGRTSFVIAQRITTVLNADQILVLEKGQVIARGKHAELMESSPVYAEIYNSQLVGDAPDQPGLASSSATQEA